MRALMMIVPLLFFTAAAPSGAGAAATPATGDSLSPVRAVRLASPVTVDGALDDAAW